MGTRNLVVKYVRRNLFKYFCWFLYILLMKEYAIPAITVIIKQQQMAIFRNIYSPFRKECAIPAINVITRQYRSIILIHIYSLFIKECNILAISVTTRQNKRLDLRNICQGKNNCYFIIET